MIHSQPSTASISQQKSTWADGVHIGHPGNLENAVLGSLHNSTTESILSWPCFDALPSVRQDYVSIFQLEQSRSRLVLSSGLMRPNLSAIDIESILTAFQHSVNVWYPTLSLVHLDGIRNIDVQELLESTDTVASCRTLLVLALGCASDVVTNLWGTSSMRREDHDFKAKRRSIAELYFDDALKLMYSVHMDMSSVAVQCLFFTA